jgi:hypothetical protein
MADKNITDLVEHYLDAHTRNRTFATTGEMLSYRLGLMIGLVKVLGENEPNVRYALLRVLQNK